MSTSQNPHQSSTDELKLFALMRRDNDVLRARELKDEVTAAPRRSPETRARIAASMRGNTNRKFKTAAVSPVANRRAAHG
jgi:hypothetical protein